MRATDVDHIIAGDNHELSNLQALSHACHTAKTTHENAAAKARIRAMATRERPPRPCARATQTNKNKTKQKQKQTKAKRELKRRDAKLGTEKKSAPKKMKPPPGTDSPPPTHERPGEIAITEWHARNGSVWGDGGHCGRVRGGTRLAP